MNRLIVLIGPKGSGKSYIGDLIEKRLGIPFVRVEPIFLKIRGERAPDNPDYIREGFWTAEREIRSVLSNHTEAVIESTGTTPVFWDMLGRLGESTNALLFRIDAPFDLYMERIRSRDSRLQIPVPEHMIRRMYEISTGTRFDAAAVIRNVGMSDDAILKIVKAARK